MMAAEGPLIAAIIARLGDPVINLAAYGVAYAFALVCEAPIIMLMKTKVTGGAVALCNAGAKWMQQR